MTGVGVAQMDKWRNPATPLEFACRQELPVGQTSSSYPTLFGPDSDEAPDSDSSYEELNHSPRILDLRDVINGPLSTLSAMLEVLLPRIKPRPEVKRLSMEDQQSFVSILVGELASQFPVLHQEIDDPFLSDEKNQELHRQMSIQVCRNLEQLYGLYIYKAATLEEGVLSMDAAMSHLRASLALEANKRLNIPRIRAEILDDQRGPIIKGPIVDRYCGQTRRPPVPKQHPVILKHGPPVHLDDTQEMESELPQLDSKYMATLELTTKNLETLYASRGIMDGVSPDDNKKEQEEIVEKEDEVSVVDEKTTGRFTQLRRVSSLPNMWGDFMLCDLKMTTRDKRPVNIKAKEDLMELHRPPSIQDMRLGEWNPAKTEIPLGKYTRNDFCDDLSSLVRLNAEPRSDPIGEDELHPLLQARVLGLSKARQARLEAYDASLRRQDEDGRREELVKTTTALMDIESIPSVPTLEQLPYMDIEHISGGTLSGFPLTGLQDSFVSSGVSQSASSRQTDGGVMKSASVRSAATQEFVSSRSGFGTRSSASQREGSLAKSSSFGRLSSVSGGVLSASLECPQSPQTPTRASPTPGMHQVRTDALVLGDEEIEKQENFESGYPSMATVDVCSSPLPSFLVSGQRSPLEVPREGGSQTQEGDLIAATRASPLQPHTNVHSSEVSDISGPQPQPDVVLAEIPGRGPVKTAQVRVSKRVPLVELRLKPYGPIYNELDRDWDSTMTEDLDSTLHEGKEVTAVYKEIMKILPGVHLQLGSEPTLEPSLKKPVKLRKIFASSSLHHRRSKRVVNKDIYRNIPCPWSDCVSKKEWEGSTEQNDEDNGCSAPVTRKKDVNIQDYLKFVSRGETDYLRLVYHLYDSQGSDSEDEEEARKKRERIANLHAKLRAREERRAHRYKEKSCFKRGQWNVNTVMMGGLGGDISPVPSEEDEDSLRKLNEKAGTMEIVESNLKLIWQRLHLPELQQIDMAIKYSSNITATELNKVLNLWEQACNYIEEREEALLKLEAFEKTASDPSRLFDKGLRGSASIRLEEARERDKLHSKLNKLDVKTSLIIKTLYKLYGDSVTYKGRLYSEKMRLDRTEMLYHLQQIRRQDILTPAIQTLSIQTNCEVEIPIN